MRNHLKGIVDDVMKRVALKEGDVVVDIGSNDGTLLSYYPKELMKVGFEPSNIKVATDIEGKMDWFIRQNFFSARSYDAASEIIGEERAKVITAAAMFYDLEDPNAFLQDIKKVLAPDGLFVIQMNYLPAMLENNAVDNISHEHLCYYSLLTLNNLLDKNGLRIEDVSFNSINGGSFRVYVRHGSAEAPGDSVLAVAMHEHAIFGDGKDPYKEFAARVKENARLLREFIVEETLGMHGGGTTWQKEHGNHHAPKRIYVLGTSTRGAVLMQLSGLDNKLIPFAVERDPAKHGKTYVGGIPIISEETARQSPPDYYLVLPYWFASEIIDREKDFLLNGGRLLLPLPIPYVISFDKV